MMSVILVLGVIITGINILNYGSTVSDADSILELLAENGGHFPEPSEGVPPPMGPGQRDPARSLELRFETRYFSVLLSSDGEVLETDTGMIAAVDEEGARQMSLDVLSSGAMKGFEGDYRFLRINNGGDVRVIFYDCGRGLDSFRSFLKASVLISVIGIVVVFILIYYASGRVVRPVAESYEKQKRFITDAGHEIKTPLAIINADADVILSDGENQWAEDIKSQVGRLTGLTNNLISLSKMEEGGTDISLVRTDLSAIVNDSCESFAAMFITGNKKLDVDVCDSIFVKGDEKSLRELVTILLDNALKYSPSGGTTEVVLKRTGKGISLQITNDTVNDIDKESCRHLFDRFYRTDKSRSSETGGYGIGLSVAQAIVNAHKGKISAEPDGNGKLTIKTVFPIPD